VPSTLTRASTTKSYMHIHTYIHTYTGTCIYVEPVATTNISGAFHTPSSDCDQSSNPAQNSSFGARKKYFSTS
jgi:hypothetical protein